MEFFENIKMKLGFGFMRLPMSGDKVDIEECTRMVDYFMENGFNYFDTAHGYIDGKSELALKETLTCRYPRNSYILTNKLSGQHFDKNEDIRPLFQSQLDACGVEYFDFYLMHAQSKGLFEKYKKCRAYETAFELKKEGKVKHVGLSFHDKASVLEEILTEYPEIEAVQIQFNYLDYDDPSVQSRKCYEVCRKFNKPVIIMEPVKGGALTNIPDEGQKIFDDLNSGSNASYAIRYCAGFDGVMMVLSGMGSMAMMRDNVSYMKDFKPLNSKELSAVEQVKKILIKQSLIPCTACRYCMERCPQQIAIPDFFSLQNDRKLNGEANTEQLNKIVSKSGKISDCADCGMCEDICPQHLEIRKLLKKAARELEIQ